MTERQLQLSLALCRRLWRFVESRQAPVPPLKYIRPQSIATWNVLGKVGTDSYSFMMKTFQTVFNISHLHPIAKVKLRTICTLFHQGFTMWRAAELDKELQNPNTSSAFNRSTRPTQATATENYRSKYASARRILRTNSFAQFLTEILKERGVGVSPRRLPAKISREEIGEVTHSHLESSS